MKQKEDSLPKVDVGIPALNEAANVKRVLHSITQQRQEFFQIRKILLLSDGSTDHTVERARELKLPKLNVLKNATRQGLPLCWYRLFQAAQADILVLLDADIELCNENVITELVRPMFDDPTITLTSGRPVKQRASSFTDRVMNVSMALQDYIKTHHQGGNSMYACHGRIVAVKQEIYSKIEPPKHILGNDSFLYFFNKTHGGAFRYAPKATVRFKMPQAFKDFSRQAKRFARAQGIQASIFGDWVYGEYRLPKPLQLESIAATFFRDPFYTICYILYHLRSKVLEKQDVTSKTHWEVPTTTKSLD